MISARGRTQTRRFLLVGLILSLMVHLFGGSLWGLFERTVDRMIPKPWASLREPLVGKIDKIEIEKPTPQHAAARPKPPAPPPPVPHVAPVPVPAPVLQHHELAHITVHAPRQTAPSIGEGVAEMPHVVRPAAGPSSRPHQYYSESQLAKMNGDFEKAISDSHQTLAQANAAVQTVPVATIKHYQMEFAGIHEGMNPGDGIIRYIKKQRIGDTMWYWTHYEYMYGDGRYEEDDIPWPFHYSINDDPFARGDRRIPLQAPPPGYVPDRPLKPILEAFFGGPQVN